MPPWVFVVVCSYTYELPETKKSKEDTVGRFLCGENVFMERRITCEYLSIIVAEIFFL